MKALEKIKKIQIAEKEITIKKLPIGKLITVLQTIGKLPEEVTNLDKQNTNALLENIPTIVAFSLPKYVNILVTATDSEEVTAEFLLDECGLDDIINLTYELLLVNNVANILETIKKIRALQQTTGVVEQAK